MDYFQNLFLTYISSSQLFELKIAGVAKWYGRRFPTSRESIAGSIPVTCSGEADHTIGNPTWIDARVAYEKRLESVCALTGT